MRCCKELLVHDNNMTSVSLLRPKAFQLLLGWEGLEVQLAQSGSFPQMVLQAEEEESPLEANNDKVALERSLSSSSSSSPLLPSPSSPSKEKGNSDRNYTAMCTHVRWSVHLSALLIT
jgi:hypothetical protein